MLLQVEPNWGQKLVRPLIRNGGFEMYFLLWGKKSEPADVVE